MTPRINLVTLGVTDLAVAKSFYERLGLTASPAGNENIVFFDVNGIVLALFGHAALAADTAMDAGDAPLFRGVTLAWNAESDAAVDAIFAQARGAGATIVKPPHKVFWGGYSGYFADPDGHLWEVAYNPFFTIDASGRLQLP
jgi:hypothetical protein